MSLDPALLAIFSGRIELAGMLFCIVIGAVIGSFLNVCIYRIPEGSLLSPARSVCRSCQKIIPWYHNIPIASFVLLRGRSACCNNRISWQYPAVEGLTAIVFGCLFIWFPFVSSRSGLPRVVEPDLLRYLHASILSSVLIVSSAIDLRHMIIPDRISIPMIVASPIVAGLHPELSLEQSLIGIAAGAGVLYAIAWLYWLVRRRVGLGFGDVKLLAFVGGWLGATSVLPTILVASMAGSAAGLIMIAVNRKLSMQSALPFGPFLSIGAFCYMLYGDKLHSLFGF
jgi:leader peptidase (prepilin peptidase)/N-methyltransferase